MNSISFDILRQTGWDTWVGICLAAAGVLLAYAIFARLWVSWRHRLLLGLCAAGILGTLAIVFVPGLHSARVGLVWTFVLLVLLSAAFYARIGRQIGPRRSALLLLLRSAALGLLVLMLFEPAISCVNRPRPQRPLLMLVDTSGSMSFPDEQNGPTRIQSVWQITQSQLPRIREHFIPRFFTFSTDLAELKGERQLAAAPADGKATDLVGAISKALGQAGREDAAIILVSDGIDNTTSDVLKAVGGSRLPIYTLRVGSDQTEPASLANISIDNVEADDDMIVDGESKVRITVRSSALADRVIDVKLAQVDADGKPAEAPAIKSLVLQPLGGGQVVELPYKPKKAGVQRLAVWVDPVPGERSTVDNRQEVQALALDPRIKVLYVEGRARPEYLPLYRALSRDSQVEAVSLLRIQQDRFTSAGLLDGKPLKGMPANAAEWRKFDVIILGDLDSSFVSRAQQTAIEQAVQEGAGFLMIGGQNSFGPGGYEGTPVESILPVFTGGKSGGQEKGEFIPRLTEEGQTHPAMEGLLEYFGTSAKAGEKPLNPLLGNVVVARPKAGAQVLLVHHDRPGPDGKPQIVLAIHRYGKGLAAAFTADTTYRWYTPMRGLGQDSPYNRFWGQLVRYLAGEDVRNRSRGAGVDGLLNKNLYQLGESVRIRAMVRDDKGDATRYAQVSAKVRRITPSPGTPGEDGGEGRQLSMTPSESRTGMYEVTLPSPDKGDWTIELTAAKDGKPLGSQSLKFTVIPPADEMLKIAANPELMKQIAARTTGRAYTLAELPALLDELIAMNPVTVRRQEFLLRNLVRAGVTAVAGPPRWGAEYDLPMQGAIALGLLTVEWILRRRWQLP